MKRFILSVTVMVLCCSLCGCSLFFIPHKQTAEELKDRWTTTDTTTTTTAPTSAARPALSPAEVNALRPDYDYGACRRLRGDVAVAVFYMDDFESSWTKEKADAFTAEAVEPALKFLEQQAARHGTELRIRVGQTFVGVPYADEVISSSADAGGYVTSDVLYQAAIGLSYSSQSAMLNDLRQKFGTEEVVCLTVFNKCGGGYAINPRRGYENAAQEHSVGFAYDKGVSKNTPFSQQASVTALYILYLYGAEDLSNDTGREQLSKLYYPNDIMMYADYDIRSNGVYGATAFYVGWTDTVPSVFFNENW